jgi:phospholipid transport system transporter-binding protein
VTEAAVAQSDAGVISLSGDLVFATVGSLLPVGSRLVRAQPESVVDLSAVARCDSAGLALLLEWVELATTAGGRLSFRSLPDALLDIARLSNVETLLPAA